MKFNRGGDSFYCLKLLVKNGDPCTGIYESAWYLSIFADIGGIFPCFLHFRQVSNHHTGIFRASKINNLLIILDQVVKLRWCTVPKSLTLQGRASM